MSVEHVREHALQVGFGGGLVHGLESRALPGGRVRLDDECAHVGRVAIVVGVESAVGVAAEGLRERIEAPRRAVPGELIREATHGGAEFAFVTVPDQRVHAVRSDDEIRLLHFIERADRVLELHRDARRPNPPLQEPQELEPSDRREADAVDGHAPAFQIERDLRPRFHRRHDGVVCLGIVLAQELERTVGEHHPEAERGVGRVLLEDTDIGRAVPPLEQIGKIESARSGPMMAMRMGYPGLRFRLSLAPSCLRREELTVAASREAALRKY